MYKYIYLISISLLINATKVIKRFQNDPSVFIYDVFGLISLLWLFEIIYIIIIFIVFISCLLNLIKF